MKIKKIIKFFIDEDFEIRTSIKMIIIILAIILLAFLIINLDIEGCWSAYNFQTIIDRILLAIVLLAMPVGMSFSIIFYVVEDGIKELKGVN